MRVRRRDPAGRHRQLLRHRPARGDRECRTPAVAADQPADRKGQDLLDGCTACRNYPAIAASFTTQVTQAFCGVASSITVLNASAAPKPLTDPYKPYPYFTQCNIFNAKARARLDLDTVSNEGLTLSQATWLLNAQKGVKATCLHAGPADGAAVALGRARLRDGALGEPVPRASPATRARQPAALPAGQLLPRHAQRRQSRAAATSRRSPPSTAAPTISW